MRQRTAPYRQLDPDYRNVAIALVSSEIDER
jgi:hypothetical protein